LVRPFLLLRLEGRRDGVGPRAWSRLSLLRILLESFLQESLCVSHTGVYIDLLVLLSMRRALVQAHRTDLMIIVSSICDHGLNLRLLFLLERALEGSFSVHTGGASFDNFG